MFYMLFLFSQSDFLYLKSKAGSYKHIKQIMCLYEPVFIGLGDRGVSFHMRQVQNLILRKGRIGMSRILSSCQKALETQMIDMQISLNKHKALMKKTFGISSAVGAMAALTTFAYASANISSFGNKVGGAISNIYNTAFKVITAAAALALLIAFAVRMAGNPQKAAQATDWIVRIVVCYIGLNCVGLIFKIIRGATDGMNSGISNITKGDISKTD